MWPVMSSKTKNTRSARIQAATMLYHYVKSVCLLAVVSSPRIAFFPHLRLPDGRLAHQCSGHELAGVPDLLKIGAG